MNKHKNSHPERKKSADKVHIHMLRPGKRYQKKYKHMNDY